MARKQGDALVYQMVQEQARLMSYLDIFMIFFAIMLMILPLVFLMKRSVATGKPMMH